MKPSITNILSLLFLMFMAHSIYNIVIIFKVPSCDNLIDSTCYVSYINTNPNLDLYLFISEVSKAESPKLIYKAKNFEYNKPLEKELQVDVSQVSRTNGSLFVHTVIIPSTAHDYKDLNTLVNIRDSTYLKNRLTKYSIPVSSTFNLLKDQSTLKSLKPVTHLRSKFAIVMCTDSLSFSRNNIPVELIKYLRINPNKQILPVVERDLMQMRMRDLVEVEKHSNSMPFTFIYNPISVGKLRFLLQIELTLHQFITLGFTEKDLDEVKGVFADTNLYLLCATIFIGSVHLLFDFLAFKNDVSFWRSQTSMAGLSKRTVLWRAFSQFVVFLYLLDEGTSLLVLIPTGLGTLIEMWKVSKVFKKNIWGRNQNSVKTESAAEIKTRQYDEECMKYLSYVLYPLCVGAAVYSLFYQPHKSWYSWTINSFVNGVYAFGFLFMLPQLFINYKLKSVAALPWRAFTYKAFNTFIDDVFAFIITMPTAHRVACFRDDIVFIIYLYQRWLYPVDKNRIEDVTTGESVTLNEEKPKKE